MAKKKADRQAGENIANRPKIISSACERIYDLDRRIDVLKAEHLAPLQEEKKKIRKAEIMGDADITVKVFNKFHYGPYAALRDIELLEDETAQQIAREQAQVALQALSEHESLDMFEHLAGGAPAAAKTPLPKADKFEQKFGGTTH